MSYFPFRAISNAPLNITVTGTSVSYAFPNNSGTKYTGSPNTLSGNTILLQNLGTDSVYFAWGDQSVTAVAPTWDGTDGSQVLPHGAIMVLSKPDNTNFPTGVTHIAFIRASADSNVRVSLSVGEGE